LKDIQVHRLLLAGIAASLTFTVFVTGILFDSISAINTNIDTLLQDVGYIKGMLNGQS